MIKVNGEKGTVKIKGNTSDILAEITTLFQVMKEDEFSGFESEEELKEALHYAVDLAFKPTESLLEEVLDKLVEDFKKIFMKGKGEE